LATISVTLYVPEEVKVWLGFRAVLVEPSLKFHCQDVGVPVDVSANCTACPAAGDTGLKVNEAVRAATTVTVRLVLFELEAFWIVKVTV